MSYFEIERNVLLEALQKMSGVVERKQTMPILANALFALNANALHLTATDLELEMRMQVAVANTNQAMEFTVSARKLMDICKAVADQEVLKMELAKNRLVIKINSSQFSLATLPAQEFPHFQLDQHEIEFNIDANVLKTLIDKVYFSMAQQDVRYYLNGILLEFNQNYIRAVATDGHRLAMKEFALELPLEYKQLILPRKATMELQRLLTVSEKPLQIGISDNHISVSHDNYCFTSKLIEGRFPDYKGVIPKPKETPIKVNRDIFKQALQRVAILANEKMHAVKFMLRKNNLILQANNPEQEEAREEIALDYSGAEITVGFNVNYFIDVLNILEQDEVVFHFGENDSVLFELEKENTLFVIMPMHI